MHLKTLFAPVLKGPGEFFPQMSLIQRCEIVACTRHFLKLNFSQLSLIRECRLYGKCRCNSDLGSPFKISRFGPQPAIAGTQLLDHACFWEVCMMLPRRRSQTCFRYERNLTRVASRDQNRSISVNFTQNKDAFINYVTSG